MAERERTPPALGTDEMKALIAAAHRALDAFLDGAEGALSAGGASAASEAFVQLREALEAHIEQEDRLYYPAIRSLRPELEIAIGKFAKDHAAFRDDTAAIQALLEDGLRADARDALERFRKSFVRHEAAEEAMLESIDQLPDGTATASE